MSKEKVLPHVVKTAFTNLVNYGIEVEDDLCDDLQILGAYIFGEESVKELYPNLFETDNENGDEESK